VKLLETWEPRIVYYVTLPLLRIRRASLPESPEATHVAPQKPRSDLRRFLKGEKRTGRFIFPRV